jgi:hypothetical protein
VRVPGVLAGSEKYYPQGLLGYAFFKRGMTAETEIKGMPGKVFVVFDDSKASSGEALDEYVKYLKESGRQAARLESPAGASVSGTDPLYKGVLIKQSGQYLVGATGLSEPSAGSALIDAVIARLPKQ